MKQKRCELQNVQIPRLETFEKPLLGKKPFNGLCVDCRAVPGRALAVRLLVLPLSSTQVTCSSSERLIYSGIQLNSLLYTPTRSMGNAQVLVKSL